MKWLIEIDSHLKYVIIQVIISDHNYSNMKKLLTTIGQDSWSKFDAD
jgi:hypothetical protein